MSGTQAEAHRPARGLRTQSAPCRIIRHRGRAYAGQVTDDNSGPQDAARVWQRRDRPALGCPRGALRSLADTTHRFGHGKAKSLAALIQALLLTGAVCVLNFEDLQRLPQATHTARFDGSSGHGKRQEYLCYPVSEPALPVRPLFD
jgi:hypothetical protein